VDNMTTRIWPFYQPSTSQQVWESELRRISSCSRSIDSLGLSSIGASGTSSLAHRPPFQLL